MQKYWLVFLTTLKEYSAYRLNFVLWRLRTFLNLLVIFFLWSAVMYQRPGFSHYTKSEMLSYVIFANVIITIVLGTRTGEIAADINSGAIINSLLKPVSFIKNYFFRDLADKLINFTFALIEISLLIFLFRPPLNFQLTIINWQLAIPLLISGVLISYFINLLLSFIGFWTVEVWAPRFLFFMVVSFLSGMYFPLDILPSTLYRLLLLTPFPYLFYLPTIALIGKLTISNWQLAIVSFLWVFLLYFFTQFIWTKGNREFSFWGR